MAAKYCWYQHSTAVGYWRVPGLILNWPGNAWSRARRSTEKWGINRSWLIVFWAWATWRYFRVKPRKRLFYAKSAIPSFESCRISMAWLKRYKGLGCCYRTKVNPNQELALYQQSLALGQELEDKGMIARVLVPIG